jgi:hypothetical protein
MGIIFSVLWIIFFHSGGTVRDVGLYFLWIIFSHLFILADTIGCIFKLGFSSSNISEALVM